MAKGDWTDPEVAFAAARLRAWVEGDIGNPPDDIPGDRVDSWRLGWGLSTARGLLEAVDDEPARETPWLWQPEETERSSEWPADGGLEGWS